MSNQLADVRITALEYRRVYGPNGARCTKLNACEHPIAVRNATPVTTLPERDGRAPRTAFVRWSRVMFTVSESAGQILGGRAASLSL